VGNQRVMSDTPDTPEPASQEHNTPAAGDADVDLTPPPEQPGGPEPLDAPAVPFLERRSAPRRRFESLFVRLIATSGIVGVSVAIAAIMGTFSVEAWIIGLVASALSVVLAAILWSTRTL
jgi:hypothetical protein